jgi:hypothetical protein
MTDPDFLVAIRPAVPEDADDVSRVNVETWLATYPNHELGITTELLRLHLAGAAGEKTAGRIARIRQGIGRRRLAATYNERAQRFYERHGFGLTGEEGHDEVATIGNVRIPETEMRRRGRSR